MYRTTLGTVLKVCTILWKSKSVMNVNCAGWIDTESPQCPNYFNKICFLRIVSFSSFAYVLARSFPMFLQQQFPPDNASKFLEYLDYNIQIIVHRYKEYRQDN